VPAWQHGTCKPAIRRTTKNDRENYGQWSGNTRSYGHAGECEQQKEAVGSAQIEIKPNGAHQILGVTSLAMAG
jgi:hypothetical protein